jgi:hypothetical protein
VRRAPNVAFDNPGTNSDNLRTSDQFDMYNGSPERYDWTLVGKKEMLVPYNSYKLHSNTLKYTDILKKNHINPEHARYELHRVWVVDSKLKPGQSHLYSRRTLYVDEDSWQILAVDCYDSRGQLYRVQEGHVINFYDVPAIWTVPDAGALGRRLVAAGARCQPDEIGAGCQTHRRVDGHGPVCRNKPRAKCQRRHMTLADGTKTQDEAEAALRRSGLIGMRHDARIEQCRGLERIFVEKIGAHELALRPREHGMVGQRRFHFRGTRLESL